MPAGNPHVDPVTLGSRVFAVNDLLVEDIHLAIDGEFVAGAQRSFATRLDRTVDRHPSRLDKPFRLTPGGRESGQLEGCAKREGVLVHKPMIAWASQRPGRPR